MDPFGPISRVKKEGCFVFKILILSGLSDVDYQKGYISGSNVGKFCIGLLLGWYFFVLLGGFNTAKN